LFKTICLCAAFYPFKNNDLEKYLCIFINVFIHNRIVYKNKIILLFDSRIVYKKQNYLAISTLALIPKSVHFTVCFLCETTNIILTQHTWYSKKKF